MTGKAAWRSVGGVASMRTRTVPMLNDLWGQGRNARFVRLLLLVAFVWSAIGQGRPPEWAARVAFATCLVARRRPWLAWTYAPQRFAMTLPALAGVAAAGRRIGSFGAAETSRPRSSGPHGGRGGRSPASRPRGCRRRRDRVGTALAAAISGSATLVALASSLRPPAS